MELAKLTTANFKREIIQATQPVVVDFWASWCEPCQMLSPLVEQAAEKVPEVKVMKCNVDEQMPLAHQFAIDSIPALLRFENGQVKAQSIGYHPLEEIEAFLKG